MTEDVFPLTLDIDGGHGQRTAVVCLGVLRAIEKTRKVYDARWQGRPVIAKVFTRPGKAWYHMRREWRGIAQLRAREVSTPRPLLCGRVRGGWAVVTEKIEAAVTAAELWEQAETLEQKEALLCRVATELARQHAKGVTQSDLHLGNFLIRGQETYSLDPAMMRFRPGEVGRSRSIRQLALLTAILSERAGPALERMFRHYAAARGWTVQAGDAEQFRHAHRRCRRNAVKRRIRKFLRSNKRHEAIRQGSWSGLAERAFLKAAGLDALTAGLDEAMARGSILKRGTTSFVSLTTLAGREVVIKRYNHKGLLHSLRHTLKGSRARKSWCNAHRLWLLGIATPMPLAYIDERRGPLLWRSYLVTEFVDAPTLSQFLRDSRVAKSSKEMSGRQVMTLLDRLADHNITHGDTKHSNILITGNGPVLTDLDGMEIHNWAFSLRAHQRKDRRRVVKDQAVHGDCGLRERE